MRKPLKPSTARMGAGESMSAGDLRAALQSLLNAKYPRESASYDTAPWLIDYFPSEMYIVYQLDGRNWRLGYSETKRSPYGPVGELPTAEPEEDHVIYEVDKTEGEEPLTAAELLAFLLTIEDLNIPVSTFSCGEVFAVRYFRAVGVMKTRSIEIE